MSSGDVLARTTSLGGRRLLNMVRPPDAVTLEEAARRSRAAAEQVEEFGHRLHGPHWPLRGSWLNSSASSNMRCRKARVCSLGTRAWRMMAESSSSAWAGAGSRAAVTR